MGSRLRVINRKLTTSAFLGTYLVRLPTTGLLARIVSGWPVIRAGALGRFTQRCFKIGSQTATIRA